MVDPETQHEHRSGYVALLGRPNVGKSTLLNAILGQSIAPVSFRPQTTRRRQLGILTTPEAQLIFIDTPGLHEPHHKLGELMNDTARDSLRDVDVVVVLFDGTQDPHKEDELVTTIIQEKSADFALLATLNKIDLLSTAEITQQLEAYQGLLPEVDFIQISATRGDGRDELLRRIIGLLPVGPQFFPDEEITDLSEREIASDLIRAAAMQHLREELPYVIAVRIDDFKERGDSGAYIAGTIFVERESQKGIVIGKGGTMLREIGTTARKEIEAMSGRKVYLELRVKVLAKWRNNPNSLERLGYKQAGN
jgi:GTP-binding protein Era